MRWNLFCGVTIAVLLIVGWEWWKLKSVPKWDRTVFIILTAAVWLLFMLNLPYTPGPTSFLEFVFRPLKGLTRP